jgi:hypothetical protein
MPAFERVICEKGYHVKTIAYIIFTIPQLARTVKSNKPFYTPTFTWDSCAVGYKNG